MQAQPTDWTPLPLPGEPPARIIAVGNTPWFDYEGTGIVDVTQNNGETTVQAEPDVVRLQNDTLQVTPETPLTCLESREHRLRWKPVR